MTLLSPGRIPCKTMEQPPGSCRAVTVSTRLMHYMPRTAAVYRKEAAACQSNPNEAVAYCRANVNASPFTLDPFPPIFLKFTWQRERLGG